MDLSGESDGDISESEIEEYEEKSYEDLVKGNYIIKNMDGTLRCPFCRGKKKQDYRYNDLLQHASGLAAGKRDAETTGCHKALSNFLKNKLATSAEPQKQRTVHLEQEAPLRPHDEELIVWPWMGIIVNIRRIFKEGKYIGPGNGELKDRFAGFYPAQVCAMWTYEGHQGKAVLEFNKDWQGYNDALSFERSFIKNHRSRKEYYEREQDPGNDLYGWVARAEDYNSGGPVGKHLRLKGDLKTVSQINDEDLRKKNKLVEDLHNTIQEKNKHIVTSNERLSQMEYLIAMTETARQKAEDEKQELEETHREELRKVEQEKQTQRSKDIQERLKRTKELEHQMNEIEEKRKELEQREAQNDFEKKKLEEEKKRVYSRKANLQRANELQRSQEEKQRVLIEKHEKQKRDLSIELHQQAKKLADRQKLELEIERLEGLIETIKQVKDGSSLDHFKKIEDLQNDLKDKNDEMESLQDINQLLMNKERRANDELQDARKTVIKVPSLRQCPMLELVVVFSIYLHSYLCYRCSMYLFLGQHLLTQFVSFNENVHLVCCYGVWMVFCSLEIGSTERCKIQVHRVARVNGIRLCLLVEFQSSSTLSAMKEMGWPYLSKVSEKYSILVQIKEMVHKDLLLKESIEFESKDTCYCIKSVIEIQILEANGTAANSEVVVKRMGVLADQPWKDACMKKYKDDWEEKCYELHSLWMEGHLKNPSWYPFRVVEKGLGHEYIVDESDELLRNLRNELGEEVCRSVVDAFKELMEYNGSGRYPVPELWHAKEKRPATLTEAILYLCRTSKRRRVARN